MKKKHTVILMLLALAALLMSATGALAADVKIALDCPPDLDKCGTYVWSFNFAEHLKANGMSVDLYPQDALGGEDEKLDQVSQGLLEVANCALSQIGQVDPIILGFHLPYLYDSIEHMDRVLTETDLLDKVNEKTTQQGVRVLSIVSVGDFSGLANTKKVIKTPADLKGLRIRALDKQQAKYIETWGASTVIIPWAEIYSALQTGIADGYLNPAIVPVMFKHTEVLKYYSDIKYSAPLRVAICSEDWFQGLDDKKKALVMEASSKADSANRTWLKKITETGIDSLKKTGVEVYLNTAEERAEFAKLVKPLYSEVVPPEVADLFVKTVDQTR